MELLHEILDSVVPSSLPLKSDQLALGKVLLDDGVYSLTSKNQGGQSHQSPHFQS